jgi:uncharacterized protein
MSDPVPQGFIAGRYLIDAYGNGGFRFADMSHRGSLIILPTGMHASPITTLKDARTENFELILSHKHEFEWLLIGTGETLMQLPIALRHFLRDQTIAYELMSTAVAVRTYNVLIAEKRAIAALMIAV